MQLGLAFALHLILIVAVAQAWMSGWPGRIPLTIGALVAVIASGAIVRRSRSAPLLIGCFAVAAVFVWVTLRFGADGGGLKLAGLPYGDASAALIVGAIGIIGWQLYRVFSSPRLPRWARFIPAVLALYAIALIVLGIVKKTPAAQLLSGAGPVPWWMSGSYIGGAVLIPLGVVAALVMLALALTRRRSGTVTALAVLLIMIPAFLVSGLELSRNGRPNLAQFVVPGGTVTTAATAPQPATAQTDLIAGLGAHEGSLAPFEGRDLDDMFARVATGVRYEPYAGILRGPIGTAIARSGNSADQSMLLAEVLRRGGYKVRFARGTLAENNVDAVIRGMYPPGIAVEQLGPEYAPYDPAADATLRNIVRDHFWVEVFQGDTWLPLDPSFPRARIGESYATGSERFDAPADALFQRIEATLKEETVNGQSRELGRFAGTTATLGMQPISLVVRSIPQSSGGDAAGRSMGSPAGAMGGMGGALGGATEEPKPVEPPKKRDRTIVGVAYVRDLSVGGVPKTIQRTTVRAGNTGGTIRREWVEFSVMAPGAQPRKVERVFYQADDKADPAVERRYSISVLSGRVPRSFVDEQTSLAASMVNVEQFEQKAKRVGDTSPEDPGAATAAMELGRMGDALGTVAGHLLALRFAAESDSLSRRIADGTGVALSWATPRILIVGIEMTGKAKGQMDAKVSLDLRLDEVTAYPYPSAPAQIVPLFHTARGIQESVIEGRLVALATGRDPGANTAQLIGVAEKQGVPLVVINTATRSRLNEVAPGVPATCVQLMDAALAKGREIIVPSRAIAMGGEQRWGWWEVDPASGQVIGVMQDGGHQGMVEYSVNSEEIGLNDESGQILGMMMGSITTVGTLSALLLKYGETTPALVKELEAYVAQILCNSCPEGASAKASASGPSVSAGAGNECYKASKKFGGSVEIGAELKVGFCDAYGKGFKCSSGIILRALKKQSMVSVDKGTIKFGGAETESKIGCADMQG